MRDEKERLSHDIRDLKTHLQDEKLQSQSHLQELKDLEIQLSSTRNLLTDKDKALLDKGIELNQLKTDLKSKQAECDRLSQHQKDTL